MGCEVLTAVLLRIKIWDITLSLLDSLGVSWSLGLHGPQDKGNTIRENMVKIYQSTQHNTPEDLNL